MKLRTARMEDWITVSSGGGEARFLVRPLTPKESAEILEKATAKRWERGQRFEEINWYKYKVLKIDSVIVNWEGLEDESGKPIPCDKKTKEVVYLHNSALIDEVLDRADLLYSGIVQSEEELSKNLNGGPGGSLKTE